MDRLVKEPDPVTENKVALPTGIFDNKKIKYEKKFGTHPSYLKNYTSGKLDIYLFKKYLRRN
jgi:hypothetical protein